MSGFELDLNSPVNVFLLVVCAAAVIYLLYRIFFVKSISDEDIDKKIQAALKAAGIQSKGAEHFNATTSSGELVFDSKEKINRNFVAFMNLYFPSFDINSINDKIKANSPTKDVQSIINDKQITAMSYFLGAGTPDRTLLGSKLFMLYIMSIYASNNDEDFILFGLGFITMIKSVMSDPEYTMNMYYFNDFKTAGDFIIYFIPTTSTLDINSETVRNNIASAEYLTLASPTAYKFAFKKGIRELLIKQNYNELKQIINPNITTQSGVAYETEIDNFINILKQNHNDLLSLYKSYYINMFLAVNGSLTKDSQSITELFNLIYSNKFTQDIRSIFNLPKAGATKPSNLDNEKNMLVNLIKEDYTRYTQMVKI